MSKNEVKIDEVLKKLEQELTESKLSRVQNQAIDKGANRVADQLKNQLGRFSGTGFSTGATAKELVVQKARKTKDGRRSTIGWNGPKKRYKLIHLNEFGYTRKGKKYRPRLAGTIGSTVKSTEPEYLNIVYKELKKAYER